MLNKLLTILISLVCINTYAVTPTPIYPNEGEVLTEDFHFICVCDNNASLTLEISDSETFENIIFRNSSRWLLLDNIKQMPMSPTELGNGTFYWRIAHESGYTTTMNFVISGQTESTTSYKIKRDPSEYPLIKIPGYEVPMGLSSLWIRSENTLNGLCQPDKGGLNHGMAVKDNIIYIPYGGLNVTNPHINRFDANTGESLDSLTIDYGKYDKIKNPLSDLGIDDNNNIYVVNAGEVTSTPINIYIDMLDVSSQEDVAIVKKRFIANIPSSTVVGNQNVIHSTVKGDLSSGNFSLYSVLKNQIAANLYIYHICRWDFNSETSSIDPADITTIESTSTSTPLYTRITPFDNESKYYIIDNNIKYPTIYNSTTRIGDLTSEQSFSPSGDLTGNGVHIFKHGNTNMMLYASNYQTEGSKFELLTLSPNFLDGTENEVASFKGIKSIWKFPSNCLGSKFSRNMNTLAASTTEITSDGYPRTKIYIYSAGNGLAAYQLTHYITSDVNNALIKEEPSYSINNGTITFNTSFKNISIYNTSGSLVTSSSNSSYINIDHLPSAIYIMNVDGNTLKLKL